MTVLLATVAAMIFTLACVILGVMAWDLCQLQDAYGRTTRFARVGRAGFILWLVQAVSATWYGVYSLVQ